MVDLDPSLLEAALDRARSLGASYAEARYHRLGGYGYTLMNGELVSASYTDSRGVAVRVIVDGSLGFSSTNRLDRQSILEAVERAVKSARAVSSLVRDPVRMAPSRLGRARYEAVEDKPLSSVGEEGFIEIGREIVGGLETKGMGIEVRSIILHMEYSVEEKLIVNTDGALVESRIPRLEAFYNLVGFHEGERANRWNQVGGSGGLELVEKLGLAREMQEDIESLRVYLVEARGHPTGKMDVVLGPEVVGLAVHESAGHPSEADRVLGREAAQAGLSYRRRMKPGERIGSEHATVIDDPTIPGSHGFYLYDDEGVPARPRYLIRNGVLDEYLHNRETAAVYGVESNAAARAKEWWAEPIVRMANTYFAPGDYRFEELIEDVKYGVYIKKYMEWNIDDYRWVARYVGFEAYEIVNGRLGRPVKNPALEANSLEFYSSVDAVGRDLRFSAGTCGKGEPGQGVPVWMGGPHIRLRGVRIL